MTQGGGDALAVCTKSVAAMKPEHGISCLTESLERRGKQWHLDRYVFFTEA